MSIAPLLLLYHICCKIHCHQSVQIRIFGKPEVVGHRRMAVILATADTVEEARKKADRAYDALTIETLPR